MADHEQPTLLGDDDEFRLDWQAWGGMPEFVNDDLTPYSTVLVHFATADDLRAFEELVGQHINKQSPRRQPFIWYPKATTMLKGDKRYRSVVKEDAE